MKGLFSACEATSWGLGFLDGALTAGVAKRLTAPSVRLDAPLTTALQT